MVPGSRLRSLASHLRAAPRPAASEQEVDEDGPLAGMLVVEWTTAIQGPAAGQYLRDMGAEVIKIEGPTGDGNRHGRGTQNDTPRVGLEPQFVSCNLGKKSLSVDVKHPESLEVINKLLDKADVFLANFTQRALDDLGLGYEVLKARNPGLVYAVRTAPHRTPPPTRCHTSLSKGSVRQVCSGFGPVGPLATRKGFDGAAQAFGGIVASTGTEDTPVMVRTGPLLAPPSPRLLSAVTWLGVVVCRWARRWRTSAARRSWPWAS